MGTSTIAMLMPGLREVCKRVGVVACLARGRRMTQTAAQQIDCTILRPMPQNIASDMLVQVLQGNHPQTFHKTLQTLESPIKLTYGHCLSLMKASPEPFASANRIGLTCTPRVCVK